MKGKNSFASLTSPLTSPRIGSKMNTFEEITNSAEETFQLGKRLGALLPGNSVLLFYGDLAAGKTTFIKGLVAGANDFPFEEVNSPTFVYLNLYEGNPTVYHFDLYRLHDSDEFLGMGFDEYFFSGGICCVEWAERIQDLHPSNAITVTMTHNKKNSRHIAITPGAMNEQISL